MTHIQRRHGTIFSHYLLSTASPRNDDAPVERIWLRASSKQRLGLTVVAITGSLIQLFLLRCLCLWAQAERQGCAGRTPAEVGHVCVCECLHVFAVDGGEEVAYLQPSALFGSAARVEAA